MSAKTTILTLPREELVHPGNRACTGCGLSIAYRIGLKALGPDTILVVPPSCLTVLQGLFPVASTKLPCLNVTFASTAAAATGVIEALKAQGRDHIKVVGWAGDGGTSDIGIQALSGAAERGDDFLFMCYDNEGYMNTGVQRSGTTPQWAITTNTPFKGKQQRKKDVPAIMAAHGIDYVATASAAYPLDLYDKIKKALLLGGHQVHPHPHSLSAGLGLRTSLQHQDRQAGRGDRVLRPLRSGARRVPPDRRLREAGGETAVGAGGRLPQEPVTLPGDDGRAGRGGPGADRRQVGGLLPGDVAAGHSSSSAALAAAARSRGVKGFWRKCTRFSNNPCPEMTSAG